MAQLKTTAWQYLHWPVAFFVTNGKDLFLFFSYIQKEIVKVVPYHKIWVPRTWYDYTPPGRGKWYEKIFITSDFHILP